MRPHHPTIEARHTRAKNHSSPPLFLHLRETKLRHEKGRAAVGPPGILEVFDADFGDGLDAAFEREAGVVEEDCRVTHAFNYGGV